MCLQLRLNKKQRYLVEDYRFVLAFRIFGDSDVFYISLFEFLVNLSANLSIDFSIIIQ